MLHNILVGQLCYGDRTTLINKGRTLNSSLDHAICCDSNVSGDKLRLKVVAKLKTFALHCILGLLSHILRKSISVGLSTDEQTL